MNDESQEEQKRRYLGNLKASLSCIAHLLEDPTVTDINRNDDGKVWVTRFGKPAEVLAEMTDAEADRAARFIASLNHKSLNVDNPRLDGIIPYGQYRFRVHINVFPWVRSSVVSIRKTAGMVYSLEEYVAQRRLSLSHFEYICEKIRKRESLLVAGSTGSGKTTLLNAILRKVAELRPNDRAFIVEDQAEIQSTIPNSVILSVESEFAGAAIEDSLRSKPSQIYFGELRTAEATAGWVESLNTGHPGGATSIHANSGVDALYRIRAKLHTAGEHNPGSKINQAIRAVIFIQNVSEGGRGPVVTEVLEVHPRMDPTSTGRFMTSRIGYSPLEEEGLTFDTDWVPVSEVVSRIVANSADHRGAHCIHKDTLKKLLTDS